MTAARRSSRDSALFTKGEYDPDHERWGNYVPTIVPGRYDAFIYIEETTALDPLHMAVRVESEPEMDPSGM